MDMGHEAIDGRKIYKRPFSHVKRGIWYWFRWKPSGVEKVDNYFKHLMEIKNLQIFRGGVMDEQFDKLKFKQVRGHYLPKLTKTALNHPELGGVSAHTKVQKYLLAHDSYTVGTEVPVNSRKYMLSGFIDIVRVVDEDEPILEVLDYKPGAHIEYDCSGQLSRYRTLLSSKMRIKNIRVGFFDENGIYMEKE